MAVASTPVTQSVGTPATAPTTSQANSATPITPNVGTPSQIPPPNTNSPVPTSQITSGALNIPPTPPSQDPNGSNLVAGSIASVNMQAAPQQQSDTSALDAATGLGQGTQDANSLYSSTQTPDEQQAQSNIDQGINEYGQESSQLGNQATDTANAYATGGVNTDMQLVNNLTTQLANQNAQYNNAAQTAETNGINSGTPSVIYQGQQAAIQRQQAVQVASTAAQLQAAQGNYTNAKALADQAVTLKYQGIQDKLTATQNFLALNQSNLTNAESQQAAKIAASVQQQQLVLNQQQAVSSLDIQYPNSGIKATDSLPQATQKAAAYIAQNGGAETLQQIGSHLDANNTEIPTYGFVNPITKQVTPYSSTGSQGNMNLGMPTDTQLGMSVYNTYANNPGIDIPTRDSNPGDIEATAESVQLPGVVGIDKSPNGNSYLIFQSPDQGTAAIATTLQGSTYQGLTAQQAINMYITGNKNKSGSYTAADVGLNPSEDFQTQIQDPTTMQNVTAGISKGEGFSASSSESSPNSTTGSGQTSFAQYGLLANTDFNPTVTLDKQANQYLDAYIKSGTEPSARTLGLGTGTNMSAIASRANNLYFEATGQPLPNPQVIQQQQQLLNSNNKLANNLAIQESTVSANINLSLSNMTKNGLNSDGFKPLNQFIDDVKDSLNDPATGQLIAQNATIQNELGSLLSIKNASGTTVYDKLSSAGIIGVGDSKQQIQTKIQALLSEAANFKTAISSANADIYSQIDPLMQDPSNPARTGYIAAQAQAPANTTFMTGPDGNQYYIPNAQIQAFMAAGGHY